MRCWPSGFALAAALAASACTGSRPHSLAPEVGGPEANSPGGPAAYGEVRVTVRWPSYGTQTIPSSATMLDISVLDASLVAVATASIARPASTAALARIASGAYTISVLARRPDATTVAEATSSVTVIANRVAQANLTLIPRFGPRLDYLWPAAGPPGTAIFLYGANLAAPPNGTFSVIVDGLPVPGSLLQPGGTPVLTSLPAWAGLNATISISVDGLDVPSSQARVFTQQIVDHVAISPASATISTDASESFTAIAYQDASGTLPIPGVSFTWSLADQVPASDPLTDFFPYSLTDGFFQTKTTTGSVIVQAQAGGKTGSASVTIQ